MTPTSPSAPPATTAFDPDHPGSWATANATTLLSTPRATVLDAQLEVLRRRFIDLHPRIAALDKLASSQGVDRIDSIASALPVFFDHRVYKTYPLSLIERRQFDRLMKWFQRLTTRDLMSIPLDGVDSVDSWLSRLDEHGMMVGHSTGTTGKLSFIPRSEEEWPAWQGAYFEAYSACLGWDPRTEVRPMFTTQYRSGHQMAAKMQRLFTAVSAGGEANRYPLYDYAISSDLLSLAGRLQAADEAGTLDELDIDPDLLRRRAELIERGRNREVDLERWFATLADGFRGQKVHLSGTYADLIRLAVTGLERGLSCHFAEGSTLFAGGGMKGYRDAPENWRDIVAQFYGMPIKSMYGMSEAMSYAPMCSEGYFHFTPLTIPVVLDDDFQPLPCEGTQHGRMALFDVLAETCWGGFISGDRVTLHWDEDCPCGWTGPRIEKDISRYGQDDGTDDKITCAGTASAYNQFMDYVSEV